MRRRLASRCTVALLAVVALIATACTQSVERPSTKCVAGCTGTIDGAAYAIRVPKNWNGTLLLYSHGYRIDRGAGPGPTATSQGDQTGTGAVSRALLGKGYAVAGSSYSSAGWAVSDAVHAADDLHNRFSRLVGAPKRTYVWGSSMGGLVTELIAEKYDWVDGSAPMCAVVAGPLLTFDHVFEGLVATKALLAPGLKITGWANASELQVARASLGAAIHRAQVDSRGDGLAKIAYLAGLLGLPRRSARFDARTPTSAFQAAAEALQRYTELGLTIGYGADRRFGANPARARTEPPSVDPRVDAAVRALNGSPEALAARVSAAQSSTNPAGASSAARRALERTGEPTGRLRVPTITLHTEYDEIALVADETVLRRRVASQHRTDRLLQLFLGPTGDNKPGAGVGHCAFTTAQQTGLIALLDGWVRTHHRPPRQAQHSAIGPGLDASFVSPPWPY